MAALLLNTIPFTLFGYAGRLIPSALMGIVNASTPLFGVVFSMLLLSDERPDRDRVLGPAIGFMGETLSWNQPLGALVIILGAALCQGVLRMRRPRTRRAARHSSNMARTEPTDSTPGT